MENFENKYALSDSWARGHHFKIPFDYTLEKSGQTVLVKRLDMADLLKMGIAEEMDFMSKSLMKSDGPADDTIESAKEAVSNAVLKSGNFEQMEKMINAVCCAGILMPAIYPLPMITKTEKGKTTTEVNEAARQPGLTYIDSVPFTDRMELFSVIYDAEGLASFRTEQTDGVGDVADVPSVQLPANGSVEIRSDDTEGILLQSGSIPVGPDGRERDEQSGESFESGSQRPSSGPPSEYSEAGSPF